MHLHDYDISVRAGRLYIIIIIIMFILLLQRPCSTRVAGGTKYCLRRQFAVHETAISFPPETQEIKTVYEIGRVRR